MLLYKKKNMATRESPGNLRQLWLILFILKNQPDEFLGRYRNSLFVIIRPLECSDVTCSTCNTNNLVLLISGLVRSYTPVRLDVKTTPSWWVYRPQLYTGLNVQMHICTFYECQRDVLQLLLQRTRFLVADVFKAPFPKETYLSHAGLLATIFCNKRTFEAAQCEGR